MCTKANTFAQRAQNSERVSSITHVNNKSNDLLIESCYIYGKSIMNEDIDSCPIDIFKPESNWYKSLLTNINNYNEEINEIEDKLKLMNEEMITKYIEEHFESRYDKYSSELEQKIIQCKSLISNSRSNKGIEVSIKTGKRVFHEETLKELSSLTKSWIDEESLDELESTKKQNEINLNNLPDLIENELRDEYMRDNQLFESEYELRKRIHQLDRLIKENNEDMIEWKNYCLSKAKEEERERLLKFYSLPHSNEDVIRDLKKFVRECVNFNYTELLDCYYNMFENLFDSISKVKYKKTIRSVFDTKSSTKVIKAFTEHNQLLITKLDYIINCIQFNNTDQFELIEETLKDSFKRIIENIFIIIYEFLRTTIEPLKNSSDTFTNSTAVKSYACAQMSVINQILIRDLNQVLTKRFNDYIEDLMEKLNVKVNSDFVGQLADDSDINSFTHNDSGNMINCSKSLKSTVKALELDFDSFLTIVPDNYINVNDLTSMYNNYFGTNLSSKSLSMLKSIRNSFTKDTKVKNCKRITLYIKNDGAYHAPDC